MKKLLLICLGVFMFALGNNVVAVNHFDFTPEEVILTMSDDVAALETAIQIEAQQVKLQSATEVLATGGCQTDILKYPNMQPVYSYKKAIKQRNNRVNNLRYNTRLNGSIWQQYSKLAQVQEHKQTRGYSYPLLCFTCNSTDSYSKPNYSLRDKRSIHGRLSDKQVFSTELRNVC